jgi:hypothetical protein
MTICSPFGNISRFNISRSTDTLHGPVNMRLADIDNNNKSNSDPPANPFGILATIVEPLI